jgi:hypothetical protein
MPEEAAYRNLGAPLIACAPRIKLTKDLFRAARSDRAKFFRKLS